MYSDMEVKMMKRLRVKKDVVIYHPSPLIAEAGSILRCERILFGVKGNRMIMNEHTHRPEYIIYFEELREI